MPSLPLTTRVGVAPNKGDESAVPATTMNPIASELERFTTRVVINPRPSERFDEIDGVRFRRAGTICILKRTREIVIVLPPGSRQFDLDFLKQEVERIRTGGFNNVSWDEEARDDGRTTYRLSLGYRADLVAEFRLGRELVPCTAEECEMYGSYHEIIDDLDRTVTMHATGRRQGPTQQPAEGPVYEVCAEQFNQGPWSVAIELVNGTLDATAAEQFAADLAYTRALCARLNGEQEPTA